MLQLKNAYKSVKLSIKLMYLKVLQLIMISVDNHDIIRLLLFTIIDSGKNAQYILLTNKIIIVINKQNRLIAHPYSTVYTISFQNL